MINLPSIFEPDLSSELARSSWFYLIFWSSWINESCMIVSGDFCVWSFIVHSLPLLELSKYENFFISHVWVVIPSVLIRWPHQSKLWSYSTVSKSNIDRGTSVLHFDSISVQNCKRQMFQRLLVQDRSPENDTFHTFDNILRPMFVKRFCHVFTTISIQRLTILFIA